MKNSGSFHISAQNIDCGYLLELPQWGSSNKYLNPCFWAKIRKLMYTLWTPVLLYKSEVQGGQNYHGAFWWWKYPPNMATL